MLNSAAAGSRGRVRVIVATTVLLSFISFWRAAAIVLSDLGSTAFYVGGIVEQAVGPSAPWFVLGVMLFSYAVRALYVESSAMFVRAGVYRVVKEALGGTMAKLSVSALLFDYVLTGPISGVSAGAYVVGLVNDLCARAGMAINVPAGPAAAVVALAITAYFWWRNTKGLHESSDDALRIMQITTVMVVVLIAWCLLTLFERGGSVPPAPTPAHLHFTTESLGWLQGSVWPTITAVALFVGLGHSILAMSGEESLAQVYRELEQPKVENLKKAGMVIFLYSLIFTALVSFFAAALIPDTVRPHYFDNLIAGLAMHLVGPSWLRLTFQVVVVLVGFLILAGAANTAIVGSNGVLNRIAEDGVLTNWFRRPHATFGTSYRLINLVVLLQVATIVLSRGNVYLLGEAYAFGVIWSFTFNAVSVLILRFKQPTAHRPWRVPLNPRVAHVEWPVGLALIALVLAICAVVNFFTKPVATVTGTAFTLMFFLLFVISERITARQRAEGEGHAVDQFQIETSDTLTLANSRVRPGGILVAVRDYTSLEQMHWALDSVECRDRDIVAVTVRLLGDAVGGEVHDCSDYERLLLSRVVTVAERHGRTVTLLVVPGIDFFDAITQAAAHLEVRTLVLGASAVRSVAEQALALGRAWDRVESIAAYPVTAVMCSRNGTVQQFPLGVHAPALTDDDLILIHRIWHRGLAVLGPSLHHRDVVAAALRHLDSELDRVNDDLGVIRLFRNEIAAHDGIRPSASD